MVNVGEYRGEVKGRVLRVKTSPETRMGTLSPYLVVRISRDSTLMGVLEGVERVRGWMVRKSMCRFESGPRTVSMKSIVLLFKLVGRLSGVYTDETVCLNNRGTPLFVFDVVLTAGPCELES